MWAVILYSIPQKFTSQNKMHVCLFVVCEFMKNMLSNKVLCVNECITLGHGGDIEYKC